MFLNERKESSSSRVGGWWGGGYGGEEHQVLQSSSTDVRMSSLHVCVMMNVCPFSLTDGGGFTQLMSFRKPFLAAVDYLETFSTTK